MVHKKLTSPGYRVNKMMMKYKFKARRKVSLKAKKTTKMVMTKKKIKKTHHWQIVMMLKANNQGKMTTKMMKDIVGPTIPKSKLQAI